MSRKLGTTLFCSIIYIMQRNKPSVQFDVPSLCFLSDCTNFHDFLKFVKCCLRFPFLLVETILDSYVVTNKYGDPISPCKPYEKDQCLFAVILSDTFTSKRFETCCQAKLKLASVRSASVMLNGFLRL